MVRTIISLYFTPRKDGLEFGLNFQISARKGEDLPYPHRKSPPPIRIHQENIPIYAHYLKTTMLFSDSYYEIYSFNGSSHKMPPCEID